MYLADLHTHTILSMDGNVPLTDMAQAAVEHGLSVLAVTDHYDMLDVNGQRDLTYDWPPALAQYNEARARFRDRLDLRLGIEMGGTPVSPDHARAIIAGAGEGLDVVIGSIHNYQEKLGGLEFYSDRFDSYEKCYIALDDYLDSMEQLAALPDCYDILGHINYPLRYMRRDGHPVVLLEHYKDRVAEILRAVIQTGRSMEVNTCRGLTVEDWRDILILYRDLGGTMVTTGSDAHLPKDVGGGLKDACALIQACGFRHLTVYNRRQAELVKI